MRVMQPKTNNPGNPGTLSPWKSLEDLFGDLGAVPEAGPLMPKSEAVETVDGFAPDVAMEVLTATHAVNAATARVTDATFNLTVQLLRKQWGLAEAPATQIAGEIQLGQAFTVLSKKADEAYAAGDYATSGYYADQIESAFKHKEAREQVELAKEIAGDTWSN